MAEKVTTFSAMATGNAIEGEFIGGHYGYRLVRGDKFLLLRTRECVCPFSSLRSFFWMKSLDNNANLTMNPIKSLALGWCLLV
jgi:hypothetical protein